MAKKKQQPQKPKYRFDGTCRECRTKVASDNIIKVCPYCEGDKLTVNDHTKLTSTARGL